MTARRATEADLQRLSAEPAAHGSGLWRTTLLGGLYLSLREGAGVLIRLGGVLALTRILGPDQYGAYAGAAALVLVLATIAQLGTEVHLIRAREEPERRDYEVVSSLLVLTTFGIGGLAALASLAVESLAGPNEFLGPFRVLLLSLPLNVLWAPAQARLERAFNFRALALLEVGGDVVLYGVAVPLALAGAGVWAPVAGYLAWQAFLLVGSHTQSRYRPRWRWEPQRFAALARWGTAYSSANWLASGRDAVHPLVVGGFLGPAAVGFVALALRLCDTLAFVNRATFRLSMVAFGRVQDDVGRLRRGLEEGVALQLLALGPVLAGFGLLAPVLIPLAFGDPWRPTIELYPFVALAFFANAVFGLQVSALAVVGRLGAVARTNAARTLTLALGALALVPWLGLIGYGWASLLTLLALAVSHREIVRVTPMGYGRAVPWVVAFAPAVFAALVPFPASLALLAPAGLVLLVPAVRGQLGEYVALVRGALRSRRGS